MKITLVSGIYPPDIGGPATFIPQLASELIKRGHEVVCLALRDSSQPSRIFEPWQEVFVKRDSLLPIRFVATTLSLIRCSKDSDVIFANGLHQEVAVANWYLKKRLVAKIVGDPVWERARNRSRQAKSIEQFQHEEIGLNIRVQRKFLTWSLKRFSLIITPGASLKEIIYSWGVSAPIYLIPNGTEVIQARSDGFKKYDIISVGRLVSWKNIDVLIESLKGTNLRLLVVGDGPQLQELRDLGERYLVDAEFYGVADPKEVDQLLQESKIFVLLSTYEGMSFSLLRAMMFGLPVIVSNIPANTDVVTNRTDGLVVSIDDRQALKSTILELARDSQMQENLGVEARKKALKDYTLAQVLDNTIKLICSESL